MTSPDPQHRIAELEHEAQELRELLGTQHDYITLLETHLPGPDVVRIEWQIVQYEERDLLDGFSETRSVLQTVADRYIERIELKKGPNGVGQRGVSLRRPWR